MTILYTPSMADFQQARGKEAVIVNRSVPQEVLAYAEDLARNGNLNAYWKKTSIYDWENSLLALLPEHDCRAWLVNDMLEQALEFANYTGDELAYLTLMSVYHNHPHQTTNGAEVFHQDDQPQALCTYGELGSEFIEANNAIATDTIDDWDVRDPSKIKRLEQAEVVFFDAYALIHRALVLQPGQFRLLYMICA